ncbi:kinase-like domain-containing protein [Amylostereum chailletii]|nr:kinase-like domain-containing protein [Amylostereum chailletii]
MVLFPLRRSRLYLSPCTHRLSRPRPSLCKRMASVATNPVEPPNKHISVGPDGQERIRWTFVEEPLGISAEEGYGWPQLEFNETVGPDNRYTICRKLGWGMSSSTWLARDQRDGSYVALKIINGSNTVSYQHGYLWEVDALKRISSPPSPHCLRLLSHFVFPGKGSAGEHLCLVTPILGGDVKGLLPAHGIQTDRVQFFPLPLAKRILKHVLRGIAHAHSRGVIHTDLKKDNIFFDCSMSTDDLDRLLMTDPSRRHLPEASPDGVFQAAVSQPLPPPTFEKIMQSTFVVADFGYAQPPGDHTGEEISPLYLRAPEVMLGGPWDEKVDIWMFGCLIFELVVGCPLFKWEPNAKHDLDAPTSMLYQMLCYTCDDVPEEQLTAGRNSGRYFGSDCDLMAKPPIVNYPFIYSIRAYKVLEREDQLSTADIMHRCLRINPARRASAAELLSDPWFDGIE